MARDELAAKNKSLHNENKSIRRKFNEYKARLEDMNFVSK